MRVIVDIDYRGQRAAADAGDRVQGEQAILGGTTHFNTQFILDRLSDQLGAGNMTGGAGTNPDEIFPHRLQPKLAVKGDDTVNIRFRNSGDAGNVVDGPARYVTKIILR